MPITPVKGRKIFGLLMILAALGMAAGLLAESARAKSRTSITEARVLKASQAPMGIGPLKQYFINVKYEFFADGLRFEHQHLVDDLPAGLLLVRFDPKKPQNSALDLPNSAPQSLGIIAGLVLVVGVGLALNIWGRLAPSRSAKAS